MERLLTPNATPTALATQLNLRPPFVKALSFASFQGDVLEYCSDMTLTIAAPQELTSDWKPAKMYDLSRAVGDSGVELKKPCLAQFAERPVLATCSAILKNEKEHSELKILERYYDSASIATSDRRMKECLQLGGDWKAIAKAPTKSSDTQLVDALRNFRETTTLN